MNKNTVELVKNQASLRFFNQLFLVPKPNTGGRPILDLSNLNQFLKAEKFKMETPEIIGTSLATGVGDISRLQGPLFPHTNRRIVQEISQVSHAGSVVSVQDTAIWTVQSSPWSLLP